MLHLQLQKGIRQDYFSTDVVVVESSWTLRSRGEWAQNACSAVRKQTNTHLDMHHMSTGKSSTDVVKCECHRDRQDEMLSRGPQSSCHVALD